VKTILGVDPGLDGAFAWLRRVDKGFELIVRDFPTVVVKKGKTNRREYSIAELKQDFQNGYADHAFIEKVHAMPGQGVTSTFTFGEGYGIVRTVCAFLETPTTLVDPAVWTRVVGLQSGATKGEHCARAASLFPGYAQLFRGPRGGLLDGRADAALIAWYGIAVLGA